jgi:hypothetical protein
MEVRLIPHPNAMPTAEFSVRIDVQRVGAVLSLRYELHGKVGLLADKPFRERVRTDELWRSTCFEAFIAGSMPGRYHELNFDLDGAWAAYSFDGYRGDMRDTPVTPDTDFYGESYGWCQVRARIDYSSLADLAGPEPWQLGLTAVIEEADGTKSYWALHHPRDEPDFHHAGGRVLELPAATAP